MGSVIENIGRTANMEDGLPPPPSMTQLIALTPLVGAGKTCSETCYYMSSLEGIRAAEILAYIRGHWHIEIRCQWVLDAIYREDHNQTLDRMLGTAKRGNSLPKREMRAALDPAFLEQLLSLV